MQENCHDIVRTKKLNIYTHWHAYNIQKFLAYNLFCMATLSVRLSAALHSNQIFHGGRFLLTRLDKTILAHSYGLQPSRLQRAESYGDHCLDEMRGCDITFSRWLCCRFLKCHGTPPRKHAGTPHWHSFGKCLALMGRKKCSEHNTPEAADGTIPHACFYRFLIHVRRTAAAAHMPDFILQARMIREKKKCRVRWPVK